MSERDAEFPDQPLAVPGDDWAGLPEKEEPWTPIEEGPPQGPPDAPPQKEEQDPPQQSSLY